MEATTESILEALCLRIGEESRLLVAFSGGADSALLAWAAHEVLGHNAVAVTAVSSSLPMAERRAAQAFASRHAMAHVQIHTDELDRDEYRRNDSQRCFHCKTALFDALVPLAQLSHARIALGTNLDDLADYRPGQHAAQLHGAIAPLVDCGLTKNNVRAVSAALGLETSAKPAAACLASRVAYGEPVSAELLARIEGAEAGLHALGFLECRVRSHGNGAVARIELPDHRIDEAIAQRATIAAEVRSHGFAFSSVDLVPLRSGSMNVLLGLPAVR